MNSQEKRSSNALRFVFVGLSMLNMLGASATEMYYKGDLPGGITNCQNYCHGMNLDPAQRYDRLPGADDQIVIVGANKTIDIDDGHFPFLATIGGINTKESVNFRCNVTIQENRTLPCWIGDVQGYGSGNTAYLVKCGPGDLHLYEGYTAATSGAMSMSYDVQEGDLFLSPPVAVGGYVGIGNVAIAEGCTVHAHPDAQIGLNSLSGAGTFGNDRTTEAASYNLLYVGSGAETVPSVFAGKLTGKWYVVTLRGYVYFTGTENDFTGALRGYSNLAGRTWSWDRAIGFVSYPASGVSSLGTASRIDNRDGPLRLRYVGAEPVTAGRLITVNETGVGPTTIDGGLWGGLTWNGNFETVSADRQQRVAFTGTNAAARSTFAGQLLRKSGAEFTFHVTKDGPGTWRFLNDVGSDWGGALTVRDGTLEFDTIAEEGVCCALGSSDERYDDQCGSLAELTPVSWAWRLGDAATASVTGSLCYVGTKDMHLESRKTAVAGAGRFRFGEGSLFKYSAGISGLGAGEKSMSFESGAGATNVIAGISDGDGKVSVVKEGDGVTVLTGELGFSGDVRAEAGELVLKDINNADYRYYRINFKENVSTSTHPGLEWYHAMFPTVRSRILVGSFGFYSGTTSSQIFKNAAGTDVSYLALAPSAAQLEGISEMNFLSNPTYGLVGGVSRLFATYGDNNLAAGVVFSPEWKDYRIPTPSDPSTWYRLHLHLADDAATPDLWDMVYYNPTNTAEYGNAVTAISIDASADGISWQEVAATNDIVKIYDTQYAWLSNPKLNDWDMSWAPQYPERKSHPGLPLSATKQQGAYARPTPRSVFVRKGATLRNESATKIQVSGLALDKSGMGTLEGFTLATSGTLSVEGLDGERAVRIPADFTNVQGYANLADWTLVVNGVQTKKYEISSVTESGVTLTKRGALLIIR